MKKIKRLSFLAGITNPVLPTYGRGEGADLIAKLIAQFLSLGFILCGVVLVIMILWSGFDWVMSEGDQNKLKSVHSKLTNAIVGFILLVAVRAIVGYLANTLNIPWLVSLRITWPTP